LATCKKSLIDNISL